MTLAELIPLLVKTSIIVVAFGFGLKAQWTDATSFFHHPGDLFRAFFAMNIVMVLLAVAMAKLFPLHPAVKLALVVLALSPVPPFLPGRQIKAGGERSYIYGLLVSMSLVAIVAVPVLVTLVGKLFNIETHVGPAMIATALLSTVLLPLGAGILVRTWKADLAERAGKWVMMVGDIMLLIAVVFILFSAWHAIVQLIGNGTLLAIIAFAAGGLMVGHLVGGPHPENRSSLALATASRHPAVALIIAHGTFPEEKRVTAAVLLYLIVSTLVSIPYLRWRKHHPGGSKEPGEKMRWRHRHA